MDLKIKYLGNDSNYWEDIKTRFSDLYPEFTFTFIDKSVDESFDPISEYLTSYKEQLNILYVDFSDESEKLIYFSKLYNQNNETRLVSTVGLYMFPQQKKFQQTAYLSGIRFHQYKTPDRHDVIYGPLALLNVDLPKKPILFKVTTQEEFKIRQHLRIGYVDSEKIHVESDCPFPGKSFIESRTHLLSEVSPSKKFYVGRTGDSDLYYGMRFWADLYHTYNGDQLFTSPDYPYLDYIYYKNNQDEYDGDFEELEKSLESYERKWKVGVDPVDNWVRIHQDGVSPKLVKVLAIDKSLKITEQLQSHTAKDYALNIQPYLPGDKYQIKRTYPHLICIQFDEEKNHKDEIENIFKSVKKLPNYDPFIVIFGVDWDKQEIRDTNDYEHVLPYKEDLNLEEMNLLAGRLSEVITQEVSGERVYFNSSQNDNVIDIFKKVEFVGLTESVVYFKADFDIPMYTGFKSDFPVPMCLTVLPHRENSSMNTPGVYRALVNGVSEDNKKKLRRYINDRVNPE